METERYTENIPLNMHQIPGSTAEITDMYEMYKKSENEELDKIKETAKKLKKPFVRKINSIINFFKSRLDRFGAEIEADLVIDIIHILPRRQKFKFIKIGMKVKDIVIQESSFLMIRVLPQEDQIKLMEIGLKSDNILIQFRSAERIKFLENEHSKRELYQQLRELIKLNLDKSKYPLSYVKMIILLPEEDQIELIKIGLKSDNPLIREKCEALVLFKISEEKKDELLPLLKEGYSERAKETPLYRKIKKDSNGRYLLSKQSFEKDGSDTTLLGSGLENKIIIRHITPESFLAWKKAFDNYNMWKNEGFDYVPVEPIVKFRLNKEVDNTVDVFSGVLDCSFFDFLEKGISPQFLSDLEKEKEKIKDVLNKNKIIHGHTHDHNFCLKFFRDSSGNIDFSKKPRIYIIDFDRAYIEE